MRRFPVYLLGLLCVACAGGPTPSSSPAAQVIARVGPTAITSTLFNLRLQSAMFSIAGAGGPGNNAAMTSHVRASVLRSLLIDTVIAQEAAAAGVAATQSEVAAQITADTTAAGGPSQLAAKLASLGGSLAQLTDEISSELNEQNLEDLFARQRAAEVEQKLAAGASMASLAPTYSDDSATASKGGELGAITRATILTGDATFSSAVLALRVGAYNTTPIRDSQGYDIVLMEASTPTAVTLRHVIIAAPQPYSARQRPPWFSEAIFEQLASDCTANLIIITITDVGDNPCAAASSAPSATPSP